MQPKTIAGWLALSLGSGGCDETPALAAAPRGPEPPAGLAPGLEPGRVLASYRWDGHAAVPWFSERLPEHLPFGELGRTARTGLYLTFPSDPSELERELAVQPEGWSVHHAALSSVPGRFGSGVRLAGESFLRAVLPPGSSVRCFTIEFWLRPERGSAGELLTLPGLLALAGSAQGELELELVPDIGAGRSGGQPLRSAALRAEEWNHVALVLDPVGERAIRLVVNGQPTGILLVPAAVGAQVSELVLGASSARAVGLEGEIDELRFQLGNTSTDELARHWLLQRGNVERARLSFAASGQGTAVTDELELWHEPLVDPRLETVSEWERGELVHACVTPEGLSSSPEHWSRIDGPDRPVARTTHPVVALDNGRVFTFGGETRDTHWGPGTNTNDTWIFEGRSGAWTSVPTPSELFPRCHMPGAYSPDHDLVLLVGGWWQGSWWDGSTPTTFDDTWAFHVGEQRWERRSPSGERFSDHGLVYLPDQRCFLLLSSRHAWLYDPERDRWERRPRVEELDEEGRPVADPRLHSYSAARDPESGLVLLFGGCRGAANDVFLDRTALYDPRTNALTRLEPPERPAARVRAALAYDPVGRRFVLFGGVRDQASARFDDLWTFDPRTRRWSEVERGSFRPSARGGYFGLAYDEGARRFVLPCGRAARDRWLDETWALELDESREGLARYVFDRAAFPLARSWFAELETPEDSQVRFRFRPSADGHRFGEWRLECPAEGRFVQVEVALKPAANGARPRVRAMGFREPLASFWKPWAPQSVPGTAPASSWVAGDSPR